jgi:hypothetical protein
MKKHTPRGQGTQRGSISAEVKAAAASIQTFPVLSAKGLRPNDIYTILRDWVFGALVLTPLFWALWKYWGSILARSPGRYVPKNIGGFLRKRG